MYVGAEEDDGEGADFREDAADDVHGFSHWSSPFCFPSSAVARRTVDALTPKIWATVRSLNPADLASRSSCLRSLFGSCLIIDACWLKLFLQ